MEWIKITYMCNGFSLLLDVHLCGPLDQINHANVRERPACVILVSRQLRKLIHVVKLSLLKNSSIWESGVEHTSKYIIAVPLQNFAIINSITVVF